MENRCITFSFYGIGVRVESDDAAILEAAEHDYSYFLSPISNCGLSIRYHRRKPDYSALPVMTTSLITTQNMIFRDENKTYLDYFGKALNVCDREKRTCDIYTDDGNLAHEIVYLAVMSGVSELLDRMRVHRIHALGFEHRGRGILILLPCMGGKSTLAMMILRDRQNSIRLLSEDSPLIRSDGTLLPFPLRIGVSPANALSGIDAKFTRKIKRMEYAPKVTINTRYFGDKICAGEVKPFAILLGMRSNGDISRIEPVARVLAMRYCKTNSVVGTGLYQGSEFVSKSHLYNLICRAGVLSSRIYNNLRLISRSKVFSFVIGRDVARNYEILLRFLKDERPQ